MKGRIAALCIEGGCAQIVNFAKSRVQPNPDLKGRSEWLQLGPSLQTFVHGAALSLVSAPISD